ncbi:MAG: hypothetical protein IBX45_03605 [Campylobacterales bacterium]|nr:hypothetical protein [Campylobacterales bacterium]
MKFIRTVSDYAIVGGVGALVVMGLQGCEQKKDEAAFTQASQTQGAFVVIGEEPGGGYAILDEYPSDVTRVILRTLDGNERILSDAELEALVDEEAKKIDAGTSSLTNESVRSGMPGLGEIVLASMAGAMIGSWIGGRLFNNATYQQQRQRAYKSPQTYSRSVDSFQKTRATSTSSTAPKRTGFFGSSSGKSQTGVVSGG